MYEKTKAKIISCDSGSCDGDFRHNSTGKNRKGSDIVTEGGGVF